MDGTGSERRRPEGADTKSATVGGGFESDMFFNGFSIFRRSINLALSHLFDEPKQNAFAFCF